MNKFGFAFLWIFCCSNGIGQSLIKGQILNVKTGEPIEAATVFIDGTSNGTQTDNDGTFKLFAAFPASVVISHVSFDPQVVNITDGATDVTIRMSERVVLLDDVTVNSRNTWEYDLAKFKRWFLGTDYWAEQALIRNEDVLSFNTDSYGKFTAETSGPIVIELPKLGYIITAELEEFIVGWNNDAHGQVGGYVGHYYFTACSDTANREMYQVNRKAAYFNSTVHFLRALYENRLEENGFEVYEKVRVTEANQKGISPISFKEFLHFEGSELKITGLYNRTFTILYFHDEKGAPTNRVVEPGNLSAQSTVRFCSDTCTVRSGGTIPDKSILFSGIIQKKQVGAMLPEDLRPEN